MKNIFPSTKIYVADSKIQNAGRGVFAACDIKKNEVVEVCPIINVSEHDTSNLDNSFLVTYFFYYGKNKNRIAVALGFGSIYNHSYTPNLSYAVKPEEQVIEFSALEGIKKDTELTFSYAGLTGKNKKNPLWFEV